MFENVINEDVIDNLDKDTLETLIAMLEKAGY
jgi:DNA-binding protein YbaB